MGKYMESKYSDVRNKIIKKSVKAPNKVLKHPEANNYGDETSCKSDLSRNINLNDRRICDFEENPKDDQPLLFNECIVTISKNLKTSSLCITLVNQDNDIFSGDTLKIRYDQYTKYNLLFSIFDEIALEGLDGITIEALWKRLNIVLKNFNLCTLKNLIWKCICSNADIEFFELPEPRRNLMINMNDDPYGHWKVFTPMFDIYKIESAPKGDILGSCPTLATRLDVTGQIRDMSLEQAYQLYKNKLVIVASQKLRTNALYDELTDINYEIMPIEYCILEKIGRSREIGEITQGVSALGIGFNMDSRSVHHYKNRLYGQNLITKQYFCLDSSLDFTKTGRLLHLRRFYRKTKTKSLIVAETIIDYLKKCPNYQCEYDAMKKLFGGIVPYKLLKTSELLKYIEKKESVPYREIYPDAAKKEYTVKSANRERVLKVLQLKSPYINIDANWAEEQYSSDEEDENEGTEIGKGLSTNLEYTRELYKIIKSYGPEGCCAGDVRHTFDVDKSTLKNSLLKLSRADLVDVKKRDLGKQRCNQYVAKYFKEQASYEPPPKIQKTQSTQVSTVEKLKQRQRQKLSGLTKDRIYTQEEFEADQNLNIQKTSHLPDCLPVPLIVCNYFISSYNNPEIIKEDIIVAEFFCESKTFKLNLIFPDILDKINLTHVLSPEELTCKKIINLDISLENIYKEKYKPDYIMKAFLILSLFKQIDFDKEAVINFLDSDSKLKESSLKRKHSDMCGKSGQKKEECLKISTNKDETIDYMGPTPVLASIKKVDTNLTVEIVMSTPPKAYVTGDITQYKPVEEVSARVLRRIQIILNEINHQVVYESIQKLSKFIYTKEMGEGYDKRIDVKSLRRILKRLISEGYLKIYKIHVRKEQVKKTQVLICHPEVGHDHEIIKAITEQLVWRFFENLPRALVIEEKREGKSSPFASKDVQASIEQLRHLKQKRVKYNWMRYSRGAVKLYGYKPKFSRMSVLHELLFYLIYDMDRRTQPLSAKERLDLFRSNQISVTAEDLDKIPPMYCKELSWKTFIPPLPHHQCWEGGWALICDVILRIPLSLITKVHCIRFYCPDLLQTLEHPIKRLYLLKDLPASVQTLFLSRRKYVHDVYDTIMRLGYCGLVQFGPSKYHEKDQTFIYLNRRASLLETMTSEPSYHKVSDKEYKRLRFQFNTFADVLKYWSTMYNICMNTPLNNRLTMIGKIITVEGEKTKPSLMEVLTVRLQDEVEELDNGKIPGDNKGAGGLDSVLWSHIKRNWFFVNTYKDFKDDLDSLKFDQIGDGEVNYDKLKIPAVTKFYIPKHQHSVKTIKTDRQANIVRVTKRNPIFKRKIQHHHPRPKKVGTRDYYDDVDKAIYKQFKGSLRLKSLWTEEENKLLIILKIAIAFLNPRHHNLVISYIAVRDILHRVLPLTKNKTSRMFERRWRRLCRDMPALQSIDVWVSNLFKLDAIQEYFVPLRMYLENEKDALGRQFKLRDAELQNAFVFLCSYIFTHREEVETTLDGNMTTIDYFNTTNIDFNRGNLVPIDETEKKYRDTDNIEKIRKYVLKNLFHSTLVCKKNNPASCYQMYKMYQKFSDTYLKSTIAEMKEHRMISYRKKMIRKFCASYKMNLHFVHSQNTVFSYQTVEAVFKTIYKLENSLFDTTSDSTERQKYGQLLALNEIMECLAEKVNITFMVPENPFILNPKMKDHSDVIEELARRFQLKLKQEQKELELQLSKKTQPSSSSTDQTDDDKPEDTLNQLETIEIDDDDIPLDLTTGASVKTIDNLKHWISDCIDSERVRSPSPELLIFDDKIKIDEIKEEIVDENMPENNEDARVLSIEEIKAEMLKESTIDEKRVVPYITDLMKLLSENFDEIEDEQNIDRLRKHFVQQYPQTETFEVEGLSDSKVLDLLQYKVNLMEIWSDILGEQHYVAPSDTSNAYQDILDVNSTIEDIDLATRILNFVYEKQELGATGPELKNQFLQDETNFSLEFLVTLLVKKKYLLKTGVTVIRFVHYKYAPVWLIEIFHLAEDQETTNIKIMDYQQLNLLQKKIDKNAETTPWVLIKVRPWITVDGTIIKDILKLWLSNICTYCSENPRITLSRLFAKFSFVSPVDIFYLLEVLKQIGCLEIRHFLYTELDFFSEYQITEDSKAGFLDNFEDMFIETSSHPFILLGNFFDYIQR
ncbi:general transcription factor 3C polypeptide 1 [Sitophilus oryzae]|uniref:General transcription factor 3C polypeptide 1 n=1 Tax=Sitophilus oryzae TaxID=7048 RepID=A0A6J2Y8S1_SITOR|nr:general transcription factor 3C polypeptide 1 [Sitophilus oryzae]